MMKNNWFYILGIFGVALTSCAAQESMKDMEEQEVIVESFEDEKSVGQELIEDTPLEEMDLTTGEDLVINEKYLVGLSLESMNGNNVEELLMANFPNASIYKEIGKQDGPDFDLFSVDENGVNLFEVFMDFNDPNNVWMVRITNTDFYDEYNVAVGTTVQKLQKLRPCIFYHADLHANVYASCENSPISYKLKGDFKSNADGGFADENYNMTADQVDEMTVESIIWTK